MKLLWARMSLAIAVSALLAGCVALTESPPLPELSVEPLEYYPGEVKGYQNSYPGEHIMVLLPVDRRGRPAGSAVTGNLSASVPDGTIEIGVISAETGATVQRVYSPAIAPIVQAALAKSAKEAGLLPTTSQAPLEAALRNMRADYVLASAITACWATKRLVYDPLVGQAWVTEATFALEIEVYKPPFHVPFWEGSKTIDYYDPPVGYDGFDPDGPALYDRPAQVLSVALTRAVAGVFATDDLQDLVRDDAHEPRRASIK